MASRILVFDNNDEYVMDMPPEYIFACTRTEQINGVHQLSITTAVVLQKGQRIALLDGMNAWREYVITGPDERHENGERPLGTYAAVWSLQYDLSGVTCDRQPGIQVPTTARVALQAALSGTTRWTDGTVDVTATGGASMWQRSAYEALSVLIETWGGEIDAEITMGETGITGRAVALKNHIGKTQATRRFEYGVDLVSIRRKVAEDVQYCRIIPLGAGSTDADVTGDRRRVTIESVNGGVQYLQNDNVVDAVKVPNGSGGYEYPTRFVVYDGIQTPQELLTKAQGDLETYTTPQVTYTATVAQYAAAGLDMHGVALGDAVDVVDYKFDDAGLVLSARAIKLVVDELDPRNTTVTLGTIGETLASSFAKINSNINALSTYIANVDSSMVAYMNNILDEVNAKVNATGGYTYLVPGRGCVTYDVAINDLSDDSAASQVTEIRGGTLRFANSRDSSGNWEWKTVILSGYLNTDLIQAHSIEAAKISTSLMDIITEWGDFIYTVQGGLLVTQPSSSIGMLINSSGSADVVGVTWTNDVPSVSGTINSFGDVIKMCNELLQISATQTSYGNDIFISSEQYKRDANGDEIVDVTGDHPYADIRTYTAAYPGGPNNAGVELQARYDSTGYRAYVSASAQSDGLITAGSVLYGIISGALSRIGEIQIRRSSATGAVKGYLYADDYDVYPQDKFRDAIGFTDGVNANVFGMDATVIPNSADLDRYYNAGAYVTGDSPSGITNAPISNMRFRLFIMHPSNTYSGRLQIVVTYTARVFVRRYNDANVNPGWESWHELLWSDNTAVPVTYTDYTDFMVPDTTVVDSSDFSASMVIYGKIAMLHVNYKTLSAISVPANGNITNIDIGTLDSGFRPKLITSGNAGGTGQLASYTIGAGGLIQLAALDARNAAYTLPAGTTFDFNATYILA